MRKIKKISHYVLNIREPKNTLETDVSHPHLKTHWLLKVAEVEETDRLHPQRPQQKETHKFQIKLHGGL